VIASNDPDLPEGTPVTGQLGWQRDVVSDGDSVPLRKLPQGIPLPLALNVLGITGLTAYFGMLDIGAPGEGDTVLVSGAAGATGSVAGQLARIQGARVIGIAGGAKKCSWLVDELGFDGAIDYKADDIEAKLDELRPDGIDLYFDNVGGETLEGCLERLRMNARIVLCGSISEYTRDEPFKLSNYTRLRATDSVMRGFFVYNHVDRWEEVMTEIAGWIGDGRLKPVPDIEEGFGAMPLALANLYYGANVGIQCCSVRGEPEEWL